jgi:type IV pilus assembly protein PilA
MMRWILLGTAGLFVIALLATIDLPCIVSSRTESNESSAVGSVKAVIEAEEQYRATYGGYAPSLANLGGATPCTKSAATACLVDDFLAKGRKAGYQLIAVGGDSVHGRNSVYVVGAAPQMPGHRGWRVFCSTEKGVIRIHLNPQGSPALPTRG